MKKNRFVKSLAFSFVIVSTFLMNQIIYAQENEVTTTESDTNNQSVVDINSNTLEAENVVYVSDTCPHCKKVEEFVTKYELDEKVSFKSVDSNEDYFKELEAYWAEFKVADQEKGTPFMIYVNDNKLDYLVGDSPIIDYFVEKYEIKIDDGNESFLDTNGKGLMIIGGIFFVSIIGYVVYSNVFDRESE